MFGIHRSYNRFFRLLFRWFALAGANMALAAVVFTSLEGCTPQKSTAPAERLERELWDLCFVQRKRVGYLRTAYYQTSESGKPAVRIKGEIHLAIKRFSQETKQEIYCTSLETPEGQLIRFTSEMKLGPQSLRTSGEVSGNHLDVDTVSAGKKISESYDWSPQYGGFFALEESLLRQPMLPGQQRAIHALISGMNQVGTIDLYARDWEHTNLTHGKEKLLRIDSMTIFPDGQQLEQTVWINRSGEVLKTRSPAMDMETFRVHKAEALQNLKTEQFDIGHDTIVKLDKPLAAARETKRVVYRLQLDGGNPAKVFFSGPTQKVKSLDSHTAEVTVYGIALDRRSVEQAASDDDLPTPEDSRPNNWIESDDPKIAALARKAVGEEKNPLRKAIALERFVHRYINQKDFSQAFATASEVAQTREGDCTEHAVLLIALCRAEKIPARAAIGLVYMPAAQAFGYHMWTEAYLHNRWIPLDAMIGQGGIGADHLKISHTSLSGATAYSSLLPVTKVVGRLKIKLLDAR